MNKLLFLLASPTGFLSVNNNNTQVSFLVIYHDLWLSKSGFCSDLSMYFVISCFLVDGLYNCVYMKCAVFLFALPFLKSFIGMTKTHAVYYLILILDNYTEPWSMTRYYWHWHSRWKNKELLSLKKIYH